MRLATLSLLWLDAGQGALLVYTMPIWGTLRAWPALAPTSHLPWGSALLFAFGTVALRSPVGLTPLKATAWQVGLRCLPNIAAGVLLEGPDPSAPSPAGWAALA